MNLTIKNYELETFAYMLYEMKLGGKKSRMRTRLFKVLQNHLNDLQEANESLIEEYAVHDENGDLFRNKDNQFKLDEQTADEYFRELEVLRDEENVIEINEATQDMILTVAKSFLEEDVALNQNEATIYDNICEQLEEIITHYELIEATE